MLQLNNELHCLNLNCFFFIFLIDAPASSNSATESLLAASECHMAVLQDDDGDT